MCSISTESSSCVNSTMLHRPSAGQAGNNTDGGRPDILRDLSPKREMFAYYVLNTCIVFINQCLIQQLLKLLCFRTVKTMTLYEILRATVWGEEIELNQNAIFCLFVSVKDKLDPLTVFITTYVVIYGICCSFQETVYWEKLSPVRQYVCFKSVTSEPVFWVQKEAWDGWMVQEW